jgi:signal transduction histidine kinase/CheY-like chemotaxis protein
MASDAYTIEKAGTHAAGNAPSGVGNLYASRYEITQVIREAPPTRTMFAVDTQAGARVVVKALQRSGLARGTIARIEHEAAVRQRIECDLLAPIVMFGESEDELYVVMPAIAGTSLGTQLESGPLSVLQALAIGRQLFTALKQLHGHRALHRDITPANVIVDSSLTEFGRFGRAMLVDFGTVRCFHPERLVGGYECARVAYMSPEEAGSIDADVGPQSDLYSAGMVLFHCLAGRPPFTGDNAGTILFEHVTSPVPHLQNINSAVPRALDELVQRLLRKDPHDRYQSAAAVAHDLQAITRALEAGQRQPQITIGATDVRCTLTDPAFVARANELGDVQDFLDRTRRGRGATMLIEGESGGGKSRLLAEVAMQARRDGLRVMRGQATTRVGDIPFRLLDGIVDGVLSACSADPRLLARMIEELGDHVDTLVSSLPRLQKLFAAQLSAASSPAAFGENRTIEALARFLDVIGNEQHPVVIILDDCQWADELTCKLIRRFNSAKGFGKYVSVIVAFRSEEVAAEHTLRSMVTSAHICLQPFENEEIRRLTESMAGTLPAEALDVVIRLAEGSPFMASAVLRGLVESGALVSRDGTWTIEPLSMAGLQSSREAAAFLARRVDLLSEKTSRLLSIGAVIGKEFTLDVVAGLSAMTPGEAIEALSQARERRLVWTRSDGGSFVFVHDQLRSSLLNRLTAEEQRKLHAEAAAYWEANSPSRTADIAFHYDAAEMPHRALSYALSAAETARSRFSLEVAERQYRIARRGAERSEQAVRFQIAEGLGDTLMLRGRYDEAAPLFAEAESLADSTIRRAQICGKAAELSFKRGDMENATVGFESALRMLGCRVPTSNILVVLLLVWEAIVQVLHTMLPKLFIGRLKRPPTESERLAIWEFIMLTHGCWYCRSKLQCLLAHLRGMNFAERFPPTPELAHAYSVHAPVMCLVPMFERAIDYARRSLEYRKGFDDLWGQGQSLNFYSCALYAASRYEECIEKGREAVRLLERTGDYWQVHIARYQVAAALYHLGRFQDALDEARLNHRSGIELGDEQASGIILDVWARAAQTEVPLDIIEKELARTRLDAQGSVQVLMAAGIREIAIGQHAAAVEHLERALAVGDEAGIQNAYTLPVAAWLATAYRHRAMEASIYCPTERKMLLKLGAATARRAIRTSKLCRNDLPRALREDGLIAAMRGDMKKARRRLDESLHVAEEQGARYEYARTLLHRGQVGAGFGWSSATYDIAAAERMIDSIVGKNEHDENAANAGGAGTLSLADRFDTLLDTGRRIASALSADKIFNEARSAALRLLRAEACLVLEIDRADLAVPPRVIVGGEQSSFSVPMVAAAIQAGRAIAFDEDFADDAQRAEQTGQRSILCAPIKVRNQIAACLYATHRQIAGLFGNDEQRLADFVSAIAGAALENGEGFTKLEILNATLEERVAERTAAAESRATELAVSNTELNRTAKELRRAEEDLRQAKDVAEAANAAKSRFLATMSHEIRTPMNGILGMTDLTLRTGLTPQQKTYLGIVRQSGGTLLHLLNDILDLSKIEAGKMTLEMIAADPHAVVSDAVRLMGSHAANKRLELLYRISPKVPTQLVCDPCRLRQVIVNLVGNAIKFTEIGEVFVDAEVEGSADGGEVLHIAVRDDGPGISRDKQSLIFDAFEQSDSSTTRRYGGTGLGLSISAQLVGLMKGRIWVESEIDHGSTFHFSIPLERVPTAVEPAAKLALEGRHVALCCNSERARNVYLETIVGAGGSCTLLPDTREGWSQLEELQATTYDRVLLVVDIGADGVKSGTLLAHPRLDLLETIPLITLLPATDRIEGLLNVKCESTNQLLKPISPTELIEALSTLTRPAAQEADELVVPEPSFGRQLHILLADDLFVNQAVATGIIEALGHRVSIAASGREAIDMFRREAFDVIFMDMEMPELDGLEATKLIREIELEQGGGRIPIVAMTAHAFSEAKQKCYDAGMDDYVPKPIQIESVADALKRVVPQQANPGLPQGDFRQFGLLAHDAGGFTHVDPAAGIE